MLSILIEYFSIIYYFQVPKFHTLYTPPHVLHTNNYLRGTWRTMLSDQFVNEGKLERNGESFHLTFRAESSRPWDVGNNMILE